MPKTQELTPPSYRLHKQSGQAIATFVDAVTGRRKDELLGKHNSKESRAKYHRLIGQWVERDGRLEDQQPTRQAAKGSVSVRHVVRAYCEHIEPLVVRSHYRAIRLALDILVGELGDTSVEKLGPKRVKDVRLVMVGRGWSRSTINKGVRFIAAAMRWAVSEELLDDERVSSKIDMIPNLKAGELGVSNGRRIEQVSVAVIDAVRPCLSPVINDMIDVQLVTGMRPGELCAMRSIDIETGGAVWTYRPSSHKNTHRNKSRDVLLGPKAIEIIRPYMRGRTLDAPLFNPRESNARRKREKAAVGRRNGQQPTPTKTDRTMGEAYSTDSYRRAIARACEQANVSAWTPNQLRHTAATRIRKEHGLEMAALLLGHSSAKTTAEHYAEADRVAMQDAVSKTG